MSNLPELIYLLPKYKDLSEIMKVFIVLQDKVNKLEGRIEKLEYEQNDR